jgi:hypothetical protein
MQNAAYNSYEQVLLSHAASPHAVRINQHTLMSSGPDLMELSLEGEITSIVHWHLLKYVAYFLVCTTFTRVYFPGITLEKEGIHPSPCSRSSSGTSNLSSNLQRFSRSMGPLMVSPFASICLIHNTRALLTSGLVTTRVRFDDKAFGLVSVRACSSCRICNLRERVACVKSRAPSCFVLKCVTTWHCAMSVHTDRHEPASTSVRFTLCLSTCASNASAGYISREPHPGTFDEPVKRECVRVGPK